MHKSKVRKSCSRSKTLSTCTQSLLLIQPLTSGSVLCLECKFVAGVNPEDRFKLDSSARAGQSRGTFTIWESQGDRNKVTDAIFLWPVLFSSSRATCFPKICQKSRDHERSQRKARHHTETDQPEGEGICLSPLDPRPTPYPTPDPTPSPAPAEIEVNPSGKTVRRRLDDAGLPLVCWSRPQITWRDVGQSLWPQKARTLRTVMTWDWLVFLSWHSLCVFFHFCLFVCCCDSSDMWKRRFSV